jgi:hypothetical protein
MDNTENEAQPEKKVRRDVTPMTAEERADHYASPGIPKKGRGRFRKFSPTVHEDGTGPQRRRLKHKQHHSVAPQVREAEAKVARLRGAAKKSAQKTLDKLKELFV